MPLCSRRAWKTPAGFPTWPTPGCYDEGVVLPRFQSDFQTGRRRVFIMTTIQTQRPTLVYVACFTVKAVSGSGRRFSGDGVSKSLQAPDQTTLGLFTVMLVE